LIDQNPLEGAGTVLHTPHSAPNRMAAEQAQVPGEGPPELPQAGTHEDTVHRFIMALEQGTSDAALPRSFA